MNDPCPSAGWVSVGLQGKPTIRTKWRSDCVNMLHVVKELKGLLIQLLFHKQLRN